MIKALIKAESLDVTKGHREKYVILILGHIILWMRSELDISKWLDEKIPIAYGCCSNPDPSKEIIEHNVPPTLLMWYQLAELEVEAVAGNNVLMELQHRTQKEGILSCEFTLNFRIMMSIVEEARIDDFIDYLSKYIGFSAYWQNERSNLSIDKPHDVVVLSIPNVEPADWQKEPYLSLAKSSILAFIISSIASEKPINSQVLFEKIKRINGIDIALSSFLIFFGKETYSSDNLYEVIATCIGKLENGETYSPEDLYIITCHVCKPEGAKGGVSDTYQDTGEKGLILIVSHGGAKTFYLYMKINGVPKRVKIGAFPDLSIEQARKQAQSLKGKIAQGVDPTDTAKQQKEEYTLKRFFYDVYLEQYAKKHTRGWQHNCDCFERHLHDLQNKRRSVITQQHIKELHNTLAHEKGLYIANRIIALIHAIFNKAIEYGWNGSNPAHSIKKFKEKSRERFLQPDELPRFMEALEAEPNHDMRDYFKMLLLTGARRSNVASMHWKDISLELATWTIPDTKNGESYVVNLPDLAVQILRERAIIQQKSGWVFPSSTSASGHLEEPKSAWKRILQRAGIEDLRIHDLRRTLGSYQAITGASGFIIGKSLGHKSSAATAIYARLNADAVRQSVERATAMIFEQTTFKVTGN